MNRQARRRNSRKKATTYQLSSEQIASMSFNSEKQAYNTMKQNLNGILKEEGRRCTLEAFKQTFYIPLLVLRNEGWGKVRLARFAENMIKQLEFFEDNAFTANDIKEMIKDETGIELEFELDFKNQKSHIKLIKN